MGPIPWSWLVAASRCGAGAMSVAIVLWHLAFLNKTNRVSLTNARLQELGVSRSQKSRVLRAFREAGLISLVAEDRRSPVVEILPTTSAHRSELHFREYESELLKHGAEHRREASEE